MKINRRYFFRACFLQYRLEPIFDPACTATSGKNQQDTAPALLPSLNITTLLKTLINLLFTGAYLDTILEPL